ncbi:CHAT domain-containing protein [Chitiniphilus eburneus]|uniref:CHAT domain-containing protein n=1 Tax=Chitiniphilus eburneus TaxID=2571148 RepID=A0A4U0Q1B3_9NEIS|nr:CHAT domain-containing protein [Chitiniphilus eburneus]TJZ74796.1 CHAT domain-containing protein [Chitiniphilus eburneus]
MQTDKTREETVKAGKASFEALLAETSVMAAPRPPTRGEGPQGQFEFDAEELQSKNLLTVYFVDGSVWYTNPQEFLARHPVESTSRGAGDTTRVRLPGALKPASQRGGTAATVNGYIVSKLDDPSTLDRIYDAGGWLSRQVDRWTGGAKYDAITSRAGLALCRGFEDHTLSRGAGLLALPPKDKARETWPDDLKGERPVLLFLHGTASSSEGSFSKLWDEHRDDFNRLTAQYEAVLGLEHRSLTESPLENVIALLKVIPADTRLHLVSHSRGGLLGELLSLAHCTDQAKARAAFQRAFDGHPDRDQVDLFFDLLATRRLRIERFVRVACPARGTLLADRRTDLFLSLLHQVVGLAFGGVANALYQAIGALAKSLVAQRADANVLPGLQAMIPGSALTRALNLYQLEVDSELRVIAGDNEAGSGLAGLKTLLADVFYALHDHDYVVQSRSMFGGLARLQTRAKSLFVHGTNVTHFSYFSNAQTARALLAALAGNDADFQSLTQDEARARGVLQAITGPQYARLDPDERLRGLYAGANAQRLPILVVLPGIMGSELSIGQERVWVSMGLLNGDIERLIPSDRDGVAATGLLPYSYERLLGQAAPRFYVIPFPFDWRRPLQQSGEALRTFLAGVLDWAERQPNPQPVHLLAHSMGGLVSRLMIHPLEAPADAKGSAEWRRLKSLGGRLLMLGVPNGGSYAPALVATGRDPFVNKLAAMDLRHSAQQYAEITARFTGFMQMLPAPAETDWPGDLTDPATWAQLAEKDPNGPAVRPADGVLEQAARVRDHLARTRDAIATDDAVVYVAGHAPETPNGLALAGELPGVPGHTPARPDPDGFRFLNCGEGDHRVTWKAGIITPPARTWYSSRAHGDLPDDQAAFLDYFNLLAGATRCTRLTPTPQAAARGAEPSPQDSEAAQLEWASLPDEAMLSAAALGASPPQPDGSTASRQPAPIRISVVHGSLDYARHPLMVGHYQGDGLFSAEKYLDRKLNGQLSMLQQLSLYPGPLRSFTVVHPDRSGPAARHPGVLVVGLGPVGALNAGALAETVTRGVLRLVLDQQERGLGAQVPLSSLLIGTNAQALSGRESLLGLLNGVWRAAQIVTRDPMLSGKVQLPELEIIEIWEDRALNAAHELRTLLARPEWRQRFYLADPPFETRVGGMARIRYEEAGNWWQRLRVVRNELGGLSYSLMGTRARAESTRVDVSIKDMAEIASNAQESLSPEIGRALFELLLPYELKDTLAQFEDSVLVLDDETARLPWELLVPPGEHREPDRPLAIQACMLRQRETADFRALPKAPQRNAALVVGDPSLKAALPALVGLKPLDGARREAEEVQRRLAQAEWEVKALLGAEASAIRTQLLAGDYRILHLAGHGVVDVEADSVEVLGTRLPLKQTGMVLSHGRLLSAAYVKQMSIVPDLVFINCCYSGLDGARDGAARDFPVLAASLATAFMGMGARAVVAAGWAVDDAAALAFASSFYDSMLSGERFGQAVLAARQRVYDEFGQQNNTWGAYQCYGDGDFQLMRSHGQSHDFDDAQHGPAFVSPRELAARIAQIASSAGDQDTGLLLAQLNDLQQRAVALGWQDSSAIQSALGAAYYDLGQPQVAAQSLLRALSQDGYSQLRLEDLLGLVDAVAQRPSGEDLALQLLDKLDDVERLATRETERESRDVTIMRATPAVGARASQRGDIHLHRAVRLGRENVLSDEFHAALIAGRDAYLDCEAAQDSEDARAYATASLLLLEGLAHLLPGHDSGNDQQLADLLKKSLETAARLRARFLDPARPCLEFWDHTDSASLGIGLYLNGSGKLSDEELALLSQARETLLGVLIRGPSPLELKWVVDRLMLIHLVCDQVAQASPAGKRKGAVQARERVEQLDAMAKVVLEAFERQLG